MEIKAKCKYDYDSTKAFVRFSMFKKANPQKRMIFWSISFVVVLAIVILELIVYDTDSILFVLLGVEITGLALLYFWYFLIPKIQYSSLSKMKDIENEYTFCDDKLKVFTKSQEFKGESTIEYCFFAKIFETSRYLFLYQTNNQAFVVDKATIEGGTIEDIRNQLTLYAKDKYFVCKY